MKAAVNRQAALSALALALTLVWLTGGCEETPVCQRPDTSLQACA